MQTLPPILGSEEAAGLLFCSPKTVEDRLRAGDLPGEKFGDAWAIPRDALLARVNQIAVEKMLARRAPRAPTAVATGTITEIRKLPRLPA